MKRLYCCDESRDLYERYYDRQQKGKGDFPVYVGRHLQRGHAMSSVLSSLFRRIIPTLKAIAPHVLRAGVDMIKDVTSGKKRKDAAIKRVPEALKRIRILGKPAATATLSTAANLLERYLPKQTGSGKRKRRRRKESVARKRVKKDIVG
jgi:hypothetical protein